MTRDWRRRFALATKSDGERLWPIFHNKFAIAVAGKWRNEDVQNWYLKPDATWERMLDWAIDNNVDVDDVIERVRRLSGPHDYL